MSVFFPQLSDGYQNSKLYKKNNYEALGNLSKFDVLVNFIIQNAMLRSLHLLSVFLVRGKSEMIESIHFEESSDLSC